MGEDRQGGADPAALSRRLTALKREGSSLLVVGADRSVHLRACRRLLGDAASAERRRLFVFTDARHRLETRLGGPEEGESARIVDWDVRTRSAAAESGERPDGNGAAAAGDEAAPDLDALSRTIETEMAALARETTTPAALRVCLDSLRPLLAADPEDVRTFLDDLRRETKRARAMTHVHLPAPADDTVDRLAPAFDAVVELRARDGVPEQRWRLVADDTTTDWLRL